MAVEGNPKCHIEAFKHDIKEIVLTSQKSYSLKSISQLVYDKKLSGWSIDFCKNISQGIYDDMYRLGILQKYLDDEDVNEIMINGLKPIIIERKGQIIITNDAFSNELSLNNLIQKIVSEVNRRANAAQPVVDARLLDGSRVNIVLKPIAVNGPILTIRKFKNYRMTLDYYLENKIINREVRDFLEQIIVRKYNIFISGATSSGKTTFLNALCEHLPEDERIITIEDAAELKLPGVKNLVTLETRHDALGHTDDINMTQLIKTALRMRPDRIIVGEVRGVEALDMIHAMNTGHDGSMSTGHSNSSKDMLSRLELMILSAFDLPLQAVKRLIGSSIDILIHLEKRYDGRRYIQSISELDFDLDYKINILYELKNNHLEKNNNLIKIDKWEKYEVI